MKSVILLLLFVLVLCGLFGITEVMKQTTGTRDEVTISTFTPPAGIYTTAQYIYLTCNPVDAEIFYTANGDDPTEALGTPFYDHIEIPLYTTRTIKARAFKAGMDPSPIVSASYVITGQVETPTFDPPGGTYYTEQHVTISCAFPDVVTIRYTTDGTEPTITSPLYTTAIVIPLNTIMTINAKAFKMGWDPSAPASATYNIDFIPQVATVTFSPSGGSYTDTQYVHLYTTTDNADIYYTTDGVTDPTIVDGFPYDPLFPIEVSGTTTIKARAYKSNWTPSNLSSATYMIGPIIPPGPNGVTVGVSGNDIQLSWNASPGALFYIIYWSNTDNGPWFFLGVSMTPAYVAIGDAGTYNTRFYEVRAVF